MISLPDIGATIRFKMAVDQAQKDAVQAAKQVAAATEAAGAGASKGFLGSLNEQFGRGSTLGQFAKLAAGGGAIFALSRAGKELADMADSGAKIADSLRSGDGNAATLAANMAKSVPVFGSLISTGNSINEIITGTDAAVKKITDSIKTASDRTSTMVAFAGEMKAEASKTADFVNQIERSIGRIGLQGNSLKLFDIGSEQAGKLKEIEERFKAARDDARRSFADYTKDAQDKIIQLGSDAGPKKIVYQIPILAELLKKKDHSQEIKEQRDLIQAADDLLRKKLAQLDADEKISVAAAKQLTVAQQFGLEDLKLAPSRFEGIAKGAQGLNEIGDAIRDIKEQTRTLHFDAFDKLVDSFKMAGAPAAQLKDLNDEIWKLRNMKLTDLLNDEVVNFTKEIANQKPEKSSSRQDRFPDLIRAGSSEAMKLAFNNSRDSTPQKQLEALKAIQKGVEDIAHQKPPAFPVVDF